MKQFVIKFMATLDEIFQNSRLSLESFWNGKIGLEMTNYALKSHCVMQFQIFNLDNFLSCL